MIKAKQQNNKNNISNKTSKILTVDNSLMTSSKIIETTSPVESKNNINTLNLEPNVSIIPSTTTLKIIPEVITDLQLLLSVTESHLISLESKNSLNIISPEKGLESISTPEVENQVETDPSQFEIKVFEKEKKINRSITKPEVLAFETSHVSRKYRELLHCIFSDGTIFGKVAWNDVKCMMENAFNGKMYGVKGGSKRQFAIFLWEKEGESTKFSTETEYNNYLKIVKKEKNLDHRIVRKVAHTEKPHSRGASKKGQTRHMYPTLVELLASSLEKIGLSPQNLGW